MEPTTKCCIRPVPQSVLKSTLYRPYKNIEFPQYPFVNYLCSPASYLPTNTLAIIQSYTKRTKRTLARLINEDAQCKKFLHQLSTTYGNLLNYANSWFVRQEEDKLGDTLYIHKLPDNASSAAIKRLKNLLTITEQQQTSQSSSSSPLNSRYLSLYFGIDAICLVHNPENLTLNFGLQTKYFIPPRFRRTIFDDEGNKQIIDVTLKGEKPVIGSGLFMAGYDALTLRGQEIL